MSLPEKIKTIAEMKNLQAEEKAMQAQKISRQVQLVVEIDAVKVRLEHIGLEGGEVLRPLVTA
jgi:hypothetical protein